MPLDIYGDNDLEVEKAGANYPDDRPGIVITDIDSPAKSPATGSQKISKCAFCRKDHKKCERTSDDVKCERCLKLNYVCFGDLDTALSNTKKRSHSRKKCEYCRDGKQKCLPVDRDPAEICERCMAYNLPCSAPGDARKRARLDDDTSTSNEQMVTAAHKSSMLPPYPAQETQHTAPQLSLNSHQSLPTAAEKSNQSTILGISDDINSTMSSHAASIHTNIVDFNNKNYALTSPKDIVQIKESTTDTRRGNEAYTLTSASVRARARWFRTVDYIMKVIRLNNILRYFLYAPEPEGIRLCNVCINLRLSRESFVVRTKYDNSRFKLQPIHLQDRLWVKPQRSAKDFSFSEIELGDVGTIGKRGYICAFCRLVWKSAQDQAFGSKPTELNAMVAYATWKIDGRQILPSGSRNTFTMKAQNRRICLHWRKAGNDFPQYRGVVLNDASIVLLGSEERGEKLLGRRMQFGKSITTLAKDWLYQCSFHHPHNNIVDEELSDWVNAIGHNFRLVDVEQMRTVPYLTEGKLPEYVALSYTWGTQHPLYYRRDQRQEFEQLGLKEEVKRIWSKIPRTIQDAINLVKQLGFRFLWVDVLCTYVADHRGSDHRAMAQIFSKAALTICAADGTGPSEGLVALNSKRTFPVQHIGKCAPNLELMVTHPAETYLRQSSWNKRGWTFQERILSTRCLIFVAGRVYWQCSYATASEDIMDNSRETSWSIDMLYNPLHTLDNLSDQHRAIRAYMRCVEEYTPRELALPDDVLLAFQAVGQVIGRSLKTDLFFGLPSSFLDLALLWEFRETPKGFQRRQLDGEQGFPTWSWCGWEGPITYRTSTLAGILSNISNWILEHTWISWYVRDRYNMTRLLHKSGQEPRTESRPDAIPRLKMEGKGSHDSSPTSISPKKLVMQSLHLQQQPQRPVKWPTMNRSMFFKSVPNLQFHTMDVDNEGVEDTQHRDTKYLQFWTWSGFFRLHNKPLPTSSNLGPGLSRYGILDDKDDFCGSIILPDQWLNRATQKMGGNAVYEFVVISEAKDFQPEEFDGWTYYIPKEKDESEWDLWYALLVEKVDDVVVKRVGLGKVFQEAFENSCGDGKEWREFIMA